MPHIRKVVVSRGLLRVVQETGEDADSSNQQDRFHVELEGEGILYSFTSLEMALFELEAIAASNTPSPDL